MGFWDTKPARPRAKTPAEIADVQLQNARSELKLGKEQLVAGKIPDALSSFSSADRAAFTSFRAAQNAGDSDRMDRAENVQEEAAQLLMQNARRHCSGRVSKPRKKTTRKKASKKRTAKRRRNPTGTLPKAGAELWERIYQASLVQYGGDKERAARVAWSVVKQKYERGPSGRWRRKNRAGVPTKRKTPDPGQLILLGDMLELHSVQRGELVIHVFGRNECQLLWSERQKALYAVPGLRGKRRPLTAKEKTTARLFYRWADRSAESAAMVQIPSPILRCEGQGIAIVYRSDKWQPKGGKVTEYIHFFEEGVRVWKSSGTPPSLFFVQGGRLRILPEGIAG